jgi:uncharacterized hydrophobic protein (TIGR00271 family)
VIILICQHADADAVRADVVPAFASAAVRVLPVPPATDPPDPPDPPGPPGSPTPDWAEDPGLAEASAVALWLPDAQVAALLPVAADRAWRLGVLPHPDAPNARAGFGLAAKPADAVADMLATEGEEPVDLLLCNGRPVLNAVVLGDPLIDTSGPDAGAVAASTPARARRRLRRLGVAWRTGLGLFRATPVRLKIRTAKGREIETAALGLVVVEHGKGAVLSRRVIEENAANDGMLNALVYAPRSVLVMLWFLFSAAAFPRSRGPARLPSFVGHIKTADLTITAMKPLAVSVDGRASSATQITLSVRRGALRLVPGRFLSCAERTDEAKEVFRVQGLYSAEMADASKARRLPWLYRASPDEFKSLFQVLRENARVSESYVILMVLSSLLATFGLFADSAPVIIGAMILAPLMSPIMAMGMGVLRQSEQAMRRESVRSFAVGVAVALLCAVALTWVTPLRTVNPQIAARVNPTLLDMGVAVISGIAGAYAHARAEVARSLAGVAIAVALVPPLAVTGIGIGWADWEVFSGAGLLFVTNFAGMVLAAAATFLVLGYSPFHFSRRGLGAALVAVVGVSALLVPSFARMVEEHRVVDTLDGWTSNGLTVSEVRVRRGDPIRVGVTLLSDEPIGVDKIDRVRDAMSELLGRPVQLEATVVVVR